jgi:hypothetical protein
MRMLNGVLALAIAWQGGAVSNVLLYAEEEDEKVAAAAPRVGLLHGDRRACPGYTLLAPLASNETYLIDLEGRVVHSWRSQWHPALSAKLLENGNLLRCAALPPGTQPFGGPGAAGRIQEFTWDGELVWDYVFALDRLQPHHDFHKLPSGNVLVIAWDRRTASEAIAAGRRPDLIERGQVLSDCVLEIKPTGPTTGEIVWRWNVWDHLVQDYDPTKDNYGNVAEHPELIDVNLSEATFGRLGAAEIVKGRGGKAGFGAGAQRRADFTTDWTHINCVAYHPQFDQIVLSVRAFSEIWIIDHSTTTDEAASHQGGRSGKGGDLLYRWGNPAAFRAGTRADQRLFKQHDAHWIPPGYPGEGNILLFNNGNTRLEGPYSSADEIALPVGADGRYRLKDGLPLEPERALWSYAAPNKQEMFSMVVSGAQRLPNGNTLICSGVGGHVLEVTPDHELVWKYVNPVHGNFFDRRPGPPPTTGRGGVPAINNTLFRAQRYSPDYPGLRGRDLTPGKLLTAVAAEQEPQPALATGN